MSIELTLVTHPVLGEAIVATDPERGEREAEALRVAREAISRTQYDVDEAPSADEVSVVGPVDLRDYTPFDLMFGNPHLICEPELNEAFDELLDGVF